MAKLERVTHKLFAENAPIVESGTTQVEIGQFGSALAGTYVATNDVATLQALPAYTRGWGGAVIPNSNFPTLEDMNAVQMVQSYQTGYLYQEGIPEYDANTTYYEGSVCKIYQDGSTSIATSLIDENTGNPLTDTGSWAISPLIAGNVLRYNQITNCLLEVPQRVKYDIADGIITIQAGTIMVVPYGTEDLTAQHTIGSVFLNSKFKVVDRQFADGKFFVWVELQSNIQGSGTTAQIFETSVVVNITGGSLTALETSSTTSSTSQSSETNNTNYRTDLNMVQFTRSGALNSNVGSFPLLIAKSDGVNVFASVSEVFNGIGYIGSTIWVDKGVKGLIPNGRNEDGTLKNIEFTTDKVLVNTYVSANGSYVLRINNGNSINATAVVDYNEDENLIYVQNTVYPSTVVGTVVYLSGQITSLQTKLPFRAVDYNDFAKVQNTAIGYPDYSKGVSKTWDTVYTAEQNGWIFIAGNLIESSANLVATINGVQFIVCRPQGGTADFGSGLFPVKKGNTYKGSGAFNYQELKFYPCI